MPNNQHQKPFMSFLGTLLILSFFTAFTIFERRNTFKKKNHRKVLSQMKTEWILLAQELNLKTNFKTESINSFIRQIEPKIWGEKNGIPILVTLESTDFLTLNTIKCSIPVKNLSQLKFEIFARRKKVLKNLEHSIDKEFESRFGIISNDFNAVIYLLSPKQRESIQRLLNRASFSRINLSLEAPNTIFEDSILDSEDKSYLRLIENEILIENEKERNHFRDKINLMLEIAHKLDS